MRPILLHIYGPFAIHSYGLFCALAIIVFMHLITKDIRFKDLISENQFFSLMTVGIVCAVVGARALFVISNWSDYTHIGQILELWEGGLSVLGGLCALIITMPWYIHRQKIDVVPFLDVAATYGPVLQSIARIGCFLGGCCHGTPTSAWWGIYMDGVSKVHPTQLYSSFFLFCIFAILYYLAHYKQLRAGTISALYLMLISAERFCVDFLRADKQYLSTGLIGYLTLQQWIACGLIGLSILFLLCNKPKLKHA
jgi:phosphatidylglycerol:prolipoprotein diacylglycerol transferase